MRDFPLVSVIIANWNGIDVFPTCLESLSRLTYPNWELIIVDNGSIDESENLVNNYKLSTSRVEIIKNKTNVGFAQANNQGYKISKGEYVLLLNNDTKVTSNFLTLMVEKMQKDENIGAMQPKIYFLDDPKLLDNSGSYLNTIGFTEHWGYAQKDSAEFDEEREIFSAKGACLLTRRSIIEKVGLFDPDFHSYFEESDFCWRVWLTGKRVIYFPKANIFHKVGFTSKRMSTVEINYYSLRNRILSFYKNLQLINLFRLLLVHLIFLIGLGMYYLLKLQWNKSFMVWRAILWNLLNVIPNIQKRSKVQKMRKVSDSELFKVILKQTNFSHMFSHFKKVEANFK